MAGLFSRLGKMADEALESASQKASELADKASVMASEAAQKAGEAYDSAAQTAGELADKASIMASEAATVIKEKSEQKKEAASEMYDSATTIIVSKIKDMVAGLPLDDAIETVKEKGKEKEIDVTPLVNFIETLKVFANDGRRE